MKKFLFFLIVSNCIAQNRIDLSYNTCNYKFIDAVMHTIEKDIWDQFIFRKDLSYAYYIDINTKHNIQVEFEDNETLECVPYQYNLVYELTDKNSNVIFSFTISFFYRNGLLEMERLGNLKDLFMPYLLVMKGKLLSISEAKAIANRNEYNPTIVELAYDEEVKNRIIWRCKEIVKDDSGRDFYKKVIVINAKTGKVLRTYKEAFM